MTIPLSCREPQPFSAKSYPESGMRTFLIYICQNWETTLNHKTGKSSDVVHPQSKNLFLLSSVSSISNVHISLVSLQRTEEER